MSDAMTEAARDYEEDEAKRELRAKAVQVHDAIECLIELRKRLAPLEREVAQIRNDIVGNEQRLDEALKAIQNSKSA
jgi:predicted  nucleic acid-binding Zn-ribbon protein